MAVPLNRANIEHLLRRTEYVARTDRVDQLLASAATIEEAVDDVLDVPANPGSVTFTETENWQQGVELTHYWLDRMAHDSARPLQEKMGFFWHGHFCSELGKVGSAELMREQIDLFRHQAIGNVRAVAKAMSTQVAMLRYLDNNQNKKSSPNQNFARELMELFLLGVGNYTEADVEAATAAWTGHSDQWDTDAYVWRDEWHDVDQKQFLGRTINSFSGNQAARQQHGAETIDVILGGTSLGNGVVPQGATIAANRGRETRAVAAEFLSKKLWIEFAGTEPSGAVLGALRDVALANDFEVRPWLRALLTRDEFYSTDVQQGLVRSPVEFTVACLVATGHRSADATPLWLMEGMGQRPLYPPNVSGWKHNGYWVNASAMAKRTDTARSFGWASMREYWEDAAVMRLAGGTITRSEVEDEAKTGQQVLDEILALMDLGLAPASYASLSSFTNDVSRWSRSDVLFLIMLAPDFHVA